MKSVICTMATAAFWIAAISSRASDKIPRNTLNEMGLSGLSVITDSEASEVRGLGAFVRGRSWAEIDGGNQLAGTNNVYDADGRFAASGANASVAARFRIRIREVEHDDGSESEVVRIRGTVIGAAGFTRAWSF